MGKTAVTRITQGKRLGCQKYIQGETQSRNSPAASIGGRIFQSSVNSKLLSSGKGISYREFLSLIGLEVEEGKNLPPINSPRVLSSLEERKKQLREKLTNMQKGLYDRGTYRIYLVHPEEDRDIPVEVDLTLISDKFDQKKTTGYFDLVYLEWKDEELYIGGGEVKLASKPQVYHYDQLVLYLLNLKKSIENYNSSLKISNRLELFLPDFNGNFRIQFEERNIERTFRAIAEEINSTLDYGDCPVSSECTICDEFKNCARRAVEENRIVAFKSLGRLREEFYRSGIKTLSDLNNIEGDESTEELLNDVFIDKKLFEAERELVKKYGFWKWDFVSLPIVKRYRQRVSPIFHIPETFVSVFVMPSQKFLNDCSFFSLSFITSNPDKIKGVINSALRKSLRRQELISELSKELEAVPFGRIEEKKYYSINISVFRSSEKVHLWTVLKEFFYRLLTGYKPNDKDGSLSRKLYIGYVSDSTFQTLTRILRRAVINDPNPNKYLERMASYLSTKDDETTSNFFRGEVGILLRRLSYVYVTNEPFVFGYPSLLSIHELLRKENPDFPDFEKFYSVELILGKGEAFNRKSLRKLSLSLVYECLASEISVVDKIKMAKKGFYYSKEDAINARDEQLLYFPLLTFLSLSAALADFIEGGEK